MNTEQIQKAIDILTEALKEPPAPEPQFTVTLQLTGRQRLALREIGRSNVSVPRVVNNYSSSTTEADVRKVLDIIGRALGDY